MEAIGRGVTRGWPGKRGRCRIVATGRVGDARGFDAVDLTCASATDGKKVVFRDVYGYRDGLFIFLIRFWF